jgi:uncharacterized protein YidB (DUF937 family)
VKIDVNGGSTMSRGPLTALLAVLAVAGYQNRDKIAEVLKGIGQRAQSGQSGADSASSAGGIGDILGNLAQGGGLGDIFGGSSPGGILSGGLGSLLEQFQRKGLGDRTESWVGTGENKPINDQELSQALGDETLNELAAKTGLSKASRCLDLGAIFIDADARRHIRLTSIIESQPPASDRKALPAASWLRSFARRLDLASRRAGRSSSSVGVHQPRTRSGACGGIRAGQVVTNSSSVPRRHDAQTYSSSSAAGK